MTDTIPTPPPTELFPNIRDIVLLLALDNGCINRFETKETYLAMVDELLGADGMYMKDLELMERALGELSQQFREVLAAGEHHECQAVVRFLNATYPDNRIGPDNLQVGEAINGFLNDVFDLPMSDAARAKQGEAFQGATDD